MEILRKYNVQTTVIFPLLAFTGDLKTSAVLATGDFKLIKDEGASANATNSVTDEGNGIYSLVLTATEMQAARIALICVDQTATKDWKDTVLLLSTYGHASGQHPFDLGTASAPQTGDNFARLGAPAGASVSADIAGVQSDTNDLQTRVPAALVSGRIDASVGAMAAGVVTAAAVATDAIDADALADGAITALTFAAGAIDAAAIAADAIGASELAADAVTEIQAGLATAAALTVVDDFLDTEVAAILAAVDTEITDIQGRLPAALVAGRMDSDVGAIQANAITATSIAANALTAAKFATGAFDAVFTRALSAVEGAATARSLAWAIAKLTNKVSISGSTLSIKQTDDTTDVFTQTLTTDAAAEPVVSMDTV